MLGKDRVERFDGWFRGVALGALVVGCASAGDREVAASRAEDTAVQAAAIRWVIDNNDSALGSSATAYCVGVGSGLVVGEPSLALIQALRGTLPPVQPISRCRWARDAAVGRRVVDDLSLAPALALLVDQPEWEGPDEARVWVEYLERPGLGRGYDCVLSRVASGWQVTDCDRGFPR
ncbi:MAG: hypothetical protein ACREK2_08780 [Gemmatimonadota bacterium]